MKKAKIILLSLLLATPLFAELKVANVVGAVDIVKTDGSVVPAKQGMKLEVGNKVKAYSDGKTVLVMDGKTRIWVKNSSEIEIKSIGKEGFFDLLAGRVRAKVKLKSGGKFSIKTPVSVASVRGTDLVVGAEGQLNVLEGIVKFENLNTQQVFDVLQGMIASFAAGGGFEPRQMTPEENNALLQEWLDNGGQIQGSSNEQNQNQNQGDDTAGDSSTDLRQELREIVNEVRSDLGQSREITDEIKDSDMSAGRTLRDVHGNVVRVEQHLLRPDDNTFQILNLTKRPDGYSYSNTNGQNWGYHGPATSRLDTMEVIVKMNEKMPEQLSEWPGFISSKGDDLHPTEMTFRMTNQRDEIKMEGLWALKGQPAEKAGETLDEDRLVMTEYINGLKVDPDFDPKDYAALPTVYKDGIDESGSDKDELWAWAVSPQIRVFDPAAPGGARFLRLGTEGYALNNSGGILRLQDFTESSKDPFTVMKEIAGEQVIFCRESSFSATSATDFKNDTDFFVRGNIDIVVTPDLVLAIAQKLAGQVGSMSDSNTSN